MFSLLQPTWLCHMGVHAYKYLLRSNNGGEDKTGVALLNHSSFSTFGHDHDLFALSIMIKFLSPSSSFPRIPCKYFRYALLVFVFINFIFRGWTEREQEHETGHTVGSIDRPGNLIRWCVLQLTYIISLLWSGHIWWLWIVIAVESDHRVERYQNLWEPNQNETVERWTGCSCTLCLHPIIRIIAVMRSWRNYRLTKYFRLKSKV